MGISMTTENSVVSTTPMTEAENEAHTAAMFERFLTDEDPSLDDNQKKPKSEGETPETEAKAADEGKGTDETAEADEAEGDGSSEEADDQGDEANQSKVTFTVKVDDKDVTFSEDELPSMIMMRSDYSRKTQALAEERKAFAEHEQKVSEERAQYAQLLPALAQQLEAMMPRMPDPALIDSDPATYLKAERAYQAEMARLNAARTEFERVSGLQQEEQARRMQAHISAAFERLPEMVPEWKDPKAFDKDKVRLREYGMKLGYSEDELNNAYDPRAVAALYKAMRFDELMAKRPPRADAPVERTVRPNPAPPAPSAPRKTRDAQVARERLARTGKVEDAALAIRSLL